MQSTVVPQKFFSRKFKTKTIFKETRKPERIYLYIGNIANNAAEVRRILQIFVTANYKNQLKNNCFNSIPFSHFFFPTNAFEKVTIDCRKISSVCGQQSAEWEKTQMIKSWTSSDTNLRANRIIKFYFSLMIASFTDIKISSREITEMFQFLDFDFSSPILFCY